MRPRFVAVAIMLAACSREPLPPQGHVLLYFDTDAPLPSAEQGVPGAEPHALFDRLLVEVFEPGASTPCTGCRRELAVDRRLVAEARASIQIPTAPGTAGYRVRARLFLASHKVGAEPSASGTLEVVAALPPAPAEGAAVATLELAIGDVGAPRGTLAAPSSLVTGAPASSKVGTWPLANSIPCEGSAGRGEVCVPGGAFWMGRPGEQAGRAHEAADRPRLVVSAPFYLDENEATVSDVRAFQVDEPGFLPWSGSTKGATITDFCTLTEAVGPNEARPVNCAFWFGARHYCLAQSKELPSEAQFERAAGALASRRFAWGDDPPSCADAVWGRGADGLLSSGLAPCRAPIAGPLCATGPSCPEARRRDVLSLKGGSLRDLAGNLQEWTLDRFQTQDEPCLTSAGVQRDPLCTAAGSRAGYPMAVRGGSWLSGSSRELAASARAAYELDQAFPTTGFRCARPGGPVTCGPVVPGLYTGLTAGGERGTLVTFGVGCSGVVSVGGFHAAGPFYLVGTIDRDGHVELEGADQALPKTPLRYVGEVVDATTLRGTWTSGDGTSGTWRVAPKK